MSRFTGLTAALALVAFALAGCSAPADRTPPPPASPSVAGDAAAALARGGLALPAGASNVTFDVATGTPYLEHYRVSFALPAAAARAFCGTGGPGGDLPAERLTTQERDDLGPDATLGQGARVCGSLAPDATHWSRTVLIGGGDPATVWVSVGRMGR